MELRTPTLTPSPHYKHQNISSYFHIPRWVDSITPEYKRLRLYVGKKYANQALVVSFLLIAMIPLWKMFKSKILSKKKPWSLKFNHSNWPWLHRILYHSEVSRIVIFWGIFSMFFIYIDTYEDLLFITKRLGRIAAASLPALLFLTMRPSPLPNTLYLALLPIHKWLSRIVVLESVLHTIFYMYYYYRIGAFYKCWKIDNLYGFVAMFAFLAIAITSLPKVRRACFNVFYFSHYLMTWVSVVTIHYHARPGVPYYTALNITILLSQILYRVYHTRSTVITSIQVSPSLEIVEFPKSDLARSPKLPAAHIRINNKHDLFFRNWFYHIVPLQHPFTIASLPNEHTVKLIIRKGRFPLKTNKEYYVTGAFEAEYDFITDSSNGWFSSIWRRNQPLQQRLFDSSFPMSRNIKAERVLIVVGGSGISFGLPLLRELSYNGVSARLIWVCKDIKDLNLLSHFKGTQGVECYITGDVNEDDIVIDYYEDSNIENDVFRIDTHESKDHNDLINEDDYEIDFTASFRKDQPVKTVPNSSKLPAFQQNFDKAHEHSALLEDPLSTKRLYGTHNTSMLTDFGEDYNCNSHSSVCKYQNCSASPPAKSYKSLVKSSISSEIDFEQFKNIKISRNIGLFYGRPNLNFSHYDWCLQSQCLGPVYNNVSGETECCRESGTHADHKVDRSKIWVVAAGPNGLVDHAKQWALDGGLQCHIESFAV
ncbi:hypothetical protein WICPIJ_009552 [Wickerhamomyces pijperi]|uniref:Ferric oxidoreductase domain-containing protein n=1 Tax=Wickerhamomyces pijperi TaxID=599730 RepID=A0A9P8PN90_WICPI|nr:hypothetical protein WICPIJ_009552 [Wickerhamomyces pijperi]